MQRRAYKGEVIGVAVKAAIAFHRDPICALIGDNLDVVGHHRCEIVTLRTGGTGYCGFSLGRNRGGLGRCGLACDAAPGPSQGVLHLRGQAPAKGAADDVGDGGLKRLAETEVGIERRPGRRRRNARDATRSGARGNLPGKLRRRRAAQRARRRRRCYATPIEKAKPNGVDLSRAILLRFCGLEKNISK